LDARCAAINFGGVPPTNPFLGSAEEVRAHPARGRLRRLGRDRLLGGAATNKSATLAGGRALAR